MQLAKYTIDQRLSASAASLVFRARRDDGLRVIVKQLRDEYPSREAAAALKREYAVLKSLDIPEVVRAVALEAEGASLALILEDSDGEPVSAIAQRPGFGVTEFLRLAIAIGRAVAAVHQKHVIHKDLKPQHLLRTSSGRVVILDFGLSTNLLHEPCQRVDPDHLEGTLAYMSPEQTGRLDRAVDRRSDLYSLGVTFYELATGRLPFSTSDQLDLVYSHIARTPPRADAVCPDLPPLVAAIIEKLMAKDAEDRYQSAAGLVADLERCLTELETARALASFDLGQKDMSDVLQIPQALYGRGGEVRVLREGLAKAQAGEMQLLLFSGPSGIGKSALVQQLRREMVLRGQFVSGKFDLLRRGDPYSALASACRELVRSILVAPPGAFASKRQALLSQLGSGAQLIIELVPELEKLLGPQPSPPPAGPAEAQSRFEQAFENFLGALVTPDEPLVVFLDDLHWADAASLHLLGRILTGHRRYPILFLGAYRDSEVSALHPLSLELQELQRKKARITDIRLGPLAEADVRQLLADTLRCPMEEVQALAAILFEKTRGNPFYLREIIELLYREALLRPDLPSHRWTWDLRAIRQRQVADNVVEMVLGKLRRLPGQAQRVVSLGACIGHGFDLRALAVASRWEPGELVQGIETALREGVLLPLDAHYRYLGTPEADGFNPRFAFVHDRVQQAAYGLIDEGQRRVLHLRLGRLLRQSLGANPSDEQLFAVARQMNRGIDAIESSDERLWLAELDLRCAKKAQATAAPALALEFARQALDLLGANGWAHSHAATSSAWLVTAECEYLSGNPARALEVLDVIDAHAPDVLDRAAAGNLRTVVLTRLGRPAEACINAAATLQGLGVIMPNCGDLPALKDAVAAEFAEVQAALAGRDLDPLLDLPEMTDPRQLATMQSLARACPPAYQTCQEFLSLVVLKATRLLLAHGACDLAPFFLGQYAIGYLASTDDRETAVRLGKLGVQSGLRRANPALAGPAYFLLGNFLAHWREPLRQCLEYLDLGLRRSLEIGDVLHAGFSAVFAVIHRIETGVPLHDVRAALIPALDMVERMADPLNRKTLLLCSQLVACLAGETKRFGSLDSDDFDEVAFEAQLEPFVASRLGDIWAMVRFHARDYDRALEAVRVCRRAAGPVASVEYRLIEGLAHAALARVSRDAERSNHLQRLSDSLQSLTRWAEECPANYGHRRALLAAELSDLNGDLAQAMDQYESAIGDAEQQGFLHIHALACELCGEFHLRGKRPRTARAYLADAVAAYSSWGAKGKVAQLCQRHASLSLLGIGTGSDAFDSGTSTRRPRAAQPVSRSTSSGSAHLPLDLQSAMRATEAIASEIESDRLLDRLLRVLVENTGAQRCVLVVPRNGQLVAEAEYRVDSEEMCLRMDRDLAAAEVPQHLIHYVARTQETLVWGDAAEVRHVADDPYLRVHAPRSALCLPLRRQAVLVAVLYLENNVASQIFDPARLARIQFLATHAASAIENSRLYEQVQAARRELEQRVVERTRELTQRNQDLRNVLDSVGQALVTIDRRGRVVGDVSAVARAWFGPIFEGDSWTDVLARVDAPYAREFAAQFGRLVSAGLTVPLTLERLPRRIAAGVRALSLDMRPVGDELTWPRLLVVVSDATDQDRQAQLELELRHNQKLKAVGTLAAGIAHEMNNPAQYVSDNLTFLAESCQDLRTVLNEYRSAVAGHEDLRARMENVEQTADVAYIEENAPAAFDRARNGIARIATLVRAMKEFSHPDQVERELVDLNRALSTTLAITAHEYNQVATMETDFDTLPPVWCHPGDMNEVFLNLIVNATHAIAEVVGASGKKGLIRVRTRREGKNVRIDVSDTGCGIRPEIRDRVFDPFFTTKRVGQGSGTGLAVAHNVVVIKHGGSITFETELGQGTTFTVCLPIERVANNP